jgi:hypothetical protein
MMGVTVALQPVIFQDANVDLFLVTMSKDPILFILFYLSIGLTAAFGLGTIESITSFLGVQDYGVIKWTKKLAYIGFSVLAVAYFKVLTVKPYMAEVYAAAAESEKNIILTMDPYISFSPNGIIIHGFVGIWILLINILALFRQGGVKICNIMGIILGGILILMTVPGLPPLFTTVLNTAEGSLAFLWFGLTGVLMIKYGKENHKVKIRNV